jgi:hypothetical protein
MSVSPHINKSTELISMKSGAVMESSEFNFEAYWLFGRTKTVEV